MRLAGRDYLVAASERLASARATYHLAQYVEALYLSGLAVECLLRAFVADRGGELDARHDLTEWYRAANLRVLMEDRQSQRASLALGEVWRRWKNTYRFASLHRLDGELRRRGLHRGIRGNALKENARVTLENAFVIVNEGTRQWQRRAK